MYDLEVLGIKAYFVKFQQYLSYFWHANAPRAGLSHYPRYGLRSTSVGALTYRGLKDCLVYFVHVLFLQA